MRNISKVSLLAICTLLATGCSGGGGSLPTLKINPATGPTSPTVSSSKTGVSFVFEIPQSSQTVVPQSVGTKHLPSTALSFSIKVSYASNATMGTPGTVAGSQNLDASTCPTTSGVQGTTPRTCTASISLQADSYLVDITSYDAAGQTGNVLSQVAAYPFMISAGTLNTVPVTLIGVPKTIRFLPDVAVATSNHFQFAPTVGAFEFAGPNPASFKLYGVDADGNVIVTGEPTFANVTASSSNTANVTVGAVGGSNGTTFPLTAQSLNVATITGSATYNGSILTAVNNVSPVEEMYVSGGSKVEGYAMFTGGMKLADIQSFTATGANMTVRSDAARKTLIALDTTSGNFYTKVESKPVNSFLSSSAVGSNDFAIAPGGGSYYVSIRNNNAVYQLSSGSGSLLNTYPVSQPIDIDFDAAGNLFAAQINFNGTIAKLPAGGIGFSTFISGLYYPAALRIGNAANGNFLYEGFDNGSGQVGIYNGTTNTGVGGLQGSSFGFNAAGENFIINGYVSPVVLNVYPPNSNVARAGRSFTFPAGESTGNFDFLI